MLIDIEIKSFLNILYTYQNKINSSLLFIHPNIEIL